MTTVSPNAFSSLFNDPTYAWELLEWEIAIEMNQALSGQAIAKLLELYMRGVEKMNSIMDVRESYFKNKVTSLMTKNTVVKTLTKPPMAKKEKPLEITAQSPKPEVKIVSKKKEDTGRTSRREAKPALNGFALQQKKKEIEMRLAYEAQESTRENLSKLVSQHQKKEEIFHGKVKDIMNDHEERLKERIHRRKLKTATYRSRPEDTNDTSTKQMDIEIIQQKKEMEQLNGRTNTLMQNHKQKRFKSLENRVRHDLTLVDSPKRNRKSTFDMTSESTEPPLGVSKVKSEELKIQVVREEKLETRDEVKMEDTE